MSFQSTELLLCLWLLPAIAYKLPLLNEALLPDDDNNIDKPNNSPFGITYKWEWQSQDRMDKGALMLARLRRDTVKFDKGGVKPYGKIPPTETPLDELSTPIILEASSVAFTKAKGMHLMKGEETAPPTDPKHITKASGKKLVEETTPLADLEQTSKEAEEKLDEDKTTPSADPEQTTKKAEDESSPAIYLVQTTIGAGQELAKEETTLVDKSVTKFKTLVTELSLNPTTSEKLSVLTSNKYNTDATVNEAHSTSGQQTSANDKTLEDFTSSLSPKEPETSPTSTPVISPTGHDVTTVRVSASSGFSANPAAVTHISTSSEVYTQTMMRQCMLTILILAVVCTIFIISTIALAAKLSTMKQKSKLRHPVSYTEMRCISSLLPESDQNKPQSKRLKTFAASMEESDGDNTTLNSFLPDH